MTAEDRIERLEHIACKLADAMLFSGPARDLHSLRDEVRSMRNAIGSEAKASDALQIYDITTDELRPATQEDINVLQDICWCFAHLKEIQQELGRHRPDITASERRAHLRKIAEYIKSID